MLGHVEHGRAGHGCAERSWRCQRSVGVLEPQQVFFVFLCEDFAMPTALVAFANGSEDMEATSVASILERGGVKVTRAAITTDGTLDVVLSHGMKVHCDAHINDCTGAYDMIVIPGGLEGATNCANCEPLVQKLKAQKASGHYIAAICAAPGFVLAHHGLIGESPATGYPGCSDNIKNYTGAHTTTDRAAKIVTGKGPAMAIEFGLACLEVLVPAETFAKVKAGMLCD